MVINHRFQKLKEVEGSINRNLYLICGGVTVAVMIMMIIQFFSRGSFPPTNITLFYLGVLIIYSFHKELVRWLGKRKVERQGELFVYSWIGLTTLFYFINFLSKNYFVYSTEGESLAVLNEVTILTLEVLGIFILTRCLKILKTVFTKRSL